MYGANLTGADLSGATLTGASLSDAILTGADLSGARLDGAHLEQCLPERYRPEQGRPERCRPARCQHYSVTTRCSSLMHRRDPTRRSNLPAYLPVRVRNRRTNLQAEPSYPIDLLVHRIRRRSKEILKLVNEFDQQNPDIHINAVPKEFFQARTAFTAAVQDGNAPDVFVPTWAGLRCLPRRVTC